MSAAPHSHWHLTPAGIKTSLSAATDDAASAVRPQPCWDDCAADRLSLNVRGLYCVNKSNDLQCLCAPKWSFSVHEYLLIWQTTSPKGSVIMVQSSNFFWVLSYSCCTNKVTTEAWNPPLWKTWAALRYNWLIQHHKSVRLRHLDPTCVNQSGYSEASCDFWTLPQTSFSFYFTPITRVLRLSLH